jgi:hypothetical protein
MCLEPPIHNLRLIRSRDGCAGHHQAHQHETSNFHSEARGFRPG